MGGYHPGQGGLCAYGTHGSQHQARGGVARTIRVSSPLEKYVGESVVSSGPGWYFTVRHFLRCREAQVCWGVAVVEGEEGERVTAAAARMPK